MFQKLPSDTSVSPQLDSTGTIPSPHNYSLVSLLGWGVLAAPSLPSNDASFCLPGCLPEGADVPLATNCGFYVQVQDAQRASSWVLRGHCDQV